MEELLLAIPLSQPQRHRAHVLPPEGLPTRRDPLRPQCRELPRRSLHRGRRQLLVMSLDPRCLIPAFDGAIFSVEWKDALWARFFMEAPRRRRRSVERYSIVKRA